MLPANPKLLQNGPEAENGASLPALPVQRIAPADAGEFAPAALNAPPSLSSLLHACRRRWPAMLSLGLLGAALTAAAVWFIFPAKYSAQTLLHIASHGPRGSSDSETDFLNFQRTQTALLKSQSVLHAALEKPEVAELREVREQEDAVAWLQKNLVTDTLLGPEIVRVSLSGDHAEDLPVLLNEIARAYLREYTVKEQSRVATRAKQLQESYRRCADSLREKRQRMRAREEQLGLDDPQTMQVRYQMALQQLAAAQNQRLQAQLERQKAQEELLGLQVRSKTAQSIAISNSAVEEELQHEPQVKKQLERLAIAEENLQRFQSLSTPGARDSLLQAPRAERDAVKQALEAVQQELKPGIEARLRAKALDEIKAGAAKLEAQIRLLQGQEKTLDGVVKGLEVQVESLRAGRGGPERVASDLEALRDDVTQTEQVLKKVGDELGTLAAEPPPASRVSLLEAAEIPVARKVDRQLKVMGAASFGVFGLILLAIALTEFQTRRIYAANDVVQGLGLRVVGTLPAVKPRGRPRSVEGGIVFDAPGTLTEAIDAVRTVLLHTARQEAMRVVMVTSAMGGEGKTSLATNLAASLARAWRKTLLIDCDLRNPAAHSPFEVPLEPGFCEALRGEIEFEEGIRPTRISRLWLLPAGRCDSHALQALAQDELRAVFERVKRHYDFIIIDAAPVLPVADALLIGQHADAALFTILRDVSRVPAVHSAQQRLTTLGIRMLGAVVIGEKTDAYAPYGSGASVALT
jgi:capsular exopolysaccharide synthesis family protein